MATWNNETLAQLLYTRNISVRQEVTVGSFVYEDDFKLLKASYFRIKSGRQSTMHTHFRCTVCNWAISNNIRLFLLRLGCT